MSDVGAAMQAWLDTRPGSSSATVVPGRAVPTGQGPAESGSPERGGPMGSALRLSQTDFGSEVDESTLHGPGSETGQPLTPRQRMLLRKQQQADQHAAELSQVRAWSCLWG
jgi:hypothetical protein